MLSPKNILIGYFILNLLIACQIPIPSKHTQIYRNPQGEEIRLIFGKNDKVQVFFHNTKGEMWDTVMIKNPNFKLVPASDSFPFLSLGWRGIQLKRDTLQVWEFSNISYIDQFIQMKGLYDSPFISVKN
jgi:hypothetical protein